MARKRRRRIVLTEQPRAELSSPGCRGRARNPTSIRLHAILHSGNDAAGGRRRASQPSLRRLRRLACAARLLSMRARELCTLARDTRADKLRCHALGALPSPNASSRCGEGLGVGALFLLLLFLRTRSDRRAETPPPPPPPHVASLRGRGAHRARRASDDLQPPPG